MRAPEGPPATPPCARAHADAPGTRASSLQAPAARARLRLPRRRLPERRPVPVSAFLPAFRAPHAMGPVCAPAAASSPPRRVLLRQQWPSPPACGTESATALAFRGGAAAARRSRPSLRGVLLLRAAAEKSAVAAGGCSAAGGLVFTAQPRRGRKREGLHYNWGARFVYAVYLIFDTPPAGGNANALVWAPSLDDR